MAARDEAHTTMSANNAEMLRAFQQIAGAIEKVSSKFDQMGQKAAKGAKEGDIGIIAMAAKVNLLGKAWDVATRAVTFYTDANKKMLQDADKAALTLDDLQRKLLITAGMTPAQGKGLIAGVEQAAVTAAVPHAEAFAGADAMLKKGFTHAEVKKGLADFLTGSRAMTGEAGGLDAAAVAMTLGGRTNMGGAIAAGRTLTKGIDLQGADLEHFFDSVGAPRKGMAAGLKDLDIDPLRVNSIGESPVEALAHIQRAIERVDQSTAQIAVGRMVGVDKADEFMRMFARAPALAAGGQARDMADDFETLRTGPAAARRQSTGKLELALAGKGSAAETIGQNLRAVDIKQGKPDWWVAARQMEYGVRTSFGQDPKNAAFAAMGGEAFGGPNDNWQGKREVLAGTGYAGGYDKQLEKFLEYLKENNDLVRQNNNLMIGGGRSKDDPRGADNTAAIKELTAAIRGSGQPQRPKAKPVQGATK